MGKRLPEAHLSTGGCSTCPGQRVHPGPQVPRSLRLHRVRWLHWLLAGSGFLLLSLGLWGQSEEIQVPCGPPLLRGRREGRKGRGKQREGAGFPLVLAAWTGGPGQSCRLPLTAPNHARSQGPSTHLRRSAMRLQQSQRARRGLQFRHLRARAGMAAPPGPLRGGLCATPHT